jgi:hypothetical protein
LADLEGEASVAAEPAVLGNVELKYLRNMNLKIRTSLAVALLVLFLGVLSFQTFHQLTEHSHELVSEREHEDEQCQFCTVKALPYLEVEILDIAFHSNKELSHAKAVYASPFSELVVVEQSGRGPPQG